jgi:hypothetical protein
MLELTDSRRTWLIETAQALKGAERRRFLARTVRELGTGGQSLAERELGWNRQTVRKALLELERGFLCLDAIALRRRKRAEEHLPALLDDIKALVDAQSQTDPAFRSNRLYTRLTAAEVRRQLIAQKGYTDDALPTERTIATKLRALGYYPSRVAKTQPQKKSRKPMPSSPSSPN